MKANPQNKKTTVKTIISKSTGLPVDRKRSLAAKKAAATRKANALIATTRSVRLHHKIIAGGAIFAVLVFTFLGIRSQLETYAASTSVGTFTGLGNKCLDNQHSVVANKNRIQLYRCNGTNAQKWTLASDGSIHSNNGSGNYCLDVPGANKAEYTYLQLYKCNGTNAQKFVVTNNTLVSRLTGFCATVRYASTADSTRIWLKNCHGSAAQKWTYSASTGNSGSTTPPPTGTGGGSTPTPPPTTQPAPPTQASDTSFTFASVPDTQRDLWNKTSIANNFDGRWNYLAQNKAKLNLQYVWQVGDLQDTDNLIFSSNKAVNPRYIASSVFNVDHFQYTQASQGLKILENAKIPYALTIGNHDTGAVCGGPACPVVAGQTQKASIEVRNTSVWNSFYTPARLSLANSQGTSASSTSGVFEPNKTDNAYRTFQAGGINWLLVNMELWPRTEAINWASTVVANHPHHNVIIITHSYLNGGGGIQGDNGGYGSNSPQYMYDNLVKKYANVKFVFSGHVGNSDYRVDTGVNGNKIYDILDCYHDTTNNWIRLLTINAQKGTMTTKVYSPVTNQTRSEASANLSISGLNWAK